MMKRKGFHLQRERGRRGGAGWRQADMQGKKKPFCREVGNKGWQGGWCEVGWRGKDGQVV